MEDLARQCVRNCCGKKLDRGNKQVHGRIAEHVICLVHGMDARHIPIREVEVRLEERVRQKDLNRRTRSQSVRRRHLAGGVV